MVVDTVTFGGIVRFPAGASDDKLQRWDDEHAPKIHEAIRNGIDAMRVLGYEDAIDPEPIVFFTDTDTGEFVAVWRLITRSIVRH